MLNVFRSLLTILLQYENPDNSEFKKILFRCSSRGTPCVINSGQRPPLASPSRSRRAIIPSHMPGSRCSETLWERFWHVSKKNKSKTLAVLRCTKTRHMPRARTRAACLVSTSPMVPWYSCPSLGRGKLSYSISQLIFGIL